MSANAIGSEGLNFRHVLARIERAQAETRKFVAEHDKLAAEAREFHRDRLLAPWLAIAGLVGGIVAVLTLVLHALRLA